MQYRLVGALVAVAAAGIVGCGGSSELSASDLRAQASTICKQVNAQIIALESGEAKTQPARLQKASVVFEGGLTKLRALKPPSGLKSGFEQFTTAYTAERDAARELSKPHPHLSVASRDALDAHKPRSVRQLALAIGLRGC